MTETRIKTRCYLSLCLAFCILMSICTSSDGAGPIANKKFIYHIYWTGIRAGMATMDYETTSSGMTIRTHATSASIISLFYPVDDFAESILYPDGYPMKYTLKTREGRYRRHKITYFEKKADGLPQKVLYQNIRDDETKEFHLDKQAYDPLSAFYAMTKMALETGQSKYIDIFDSKKLLHTEVEILRKEKIRIQSGEFDTLLIKPLLHSEGIFRRTGDIFIWVTDDDRKLPVLVKSKALIGAFTAELVEGDF